MTLDTFMRTADTLPSTPRMPAVFVGHGSPTNAIEHNVFTRAWSDLGITLPRPQAILCISAHWLTRGVYVEASERPRMIYDFYGFPEEMYHITYPCIGAPQYAQVAQEVVRPLVLNTSTDWGIDHGTWVVLKHMYPQADIPVFQMSIDMSKPGDWHYRLAHALRPLREKGVMIVSSGNIVHNLGLLNFSTQAAPFDWAQEFDTNVVSAIHDHNDASLYDYHQLGSSARFAVPTPDHYWPMIYTLGLRHPEESVTYPVSGILFGSLSMRCLLIR